MENENTENNKQAEQQVTPEFISKAPNMCVAAFNALDSNGCFRTVFIHPQDVTDIKRIEPAVQGVKTAIGYKKICGEEFAIPGTVLVSEWFGEVLSTLGAKETASYHYTCNYPLAGVTREGDGLKYDHVLGGLKCRPELQ